MESEDIEFCKFYKYLQNQFRSLYENAQNRQFFICVPRNDSVLGVEFDLNFVEFHILKPSPFFKGHYNTIHLTNSHTLAIEGNRIIKGEGFEDSTEVKIIREELGYNKNYEQYKILIIDKPLIPVTINKAREAEEKCADGPIRDLFLYEECLSFLQRYQECREVLQKLNEQLTVFKENYLVLPGYLGDAASRLHTVYHQAWQDFTQAVYGPQGEDDRFLHNVQRSVENVILHDAHDKVFSAVCKECAPKERRLLEKLHTLRSASPEALGVPKQLRCDMSAPVSMCRELDKQKTPLELLCHMKTILDGISQTVNTHLSGRVVTVTSQQQQLITTDDVIPLLIYVLIHAKPPHLLSVQHYIEHFHWSTSPADNLSYSLVTFQAATQHIGHLDAEQLTQQPSRPGLDVTENKQTTEAGGMANRSTDGGEERRNTRLERQLERINRMLKSTSLVPNPPDGASSAILTPPARPLSMQRGSRYRQNQNAQLGSFLSSLKDDALGSSYGKQS